MFFKFLGITQNVPWIALDTFDLRKTGIFVAVGYNSMIASGGVTVMKVENRFSYCSQHF